MARCKKSEPRYYVIEDGIPIPPRDFSGRKPIYIPFKEMRVGDSFLVPPNEDIQSIKRRLFKFVKDKALEGISISYAERRTDDGAKRFWRVK